MIAENLERLKILNPALYDEITLGVELISWHHPRNRLLDHLQGCIQRAITTRIDHEAEKSRETWSYEIIADRDGFKALVGPRDVRSFFEYGDSPADALLAAYCEACE